MILFYVNKIQSTTEQYLWRIEGEAPFSQEFQAKPSLINRKHNRKTFSDIKYSKKLFCLFMYIYINLIWFGSSQLDHTIQELQPQGTLKKLDSGPYRYLMKIFRKMVMRCFPQCLAEKLGLMFMRVQTKPKSDI
jgi:hypothetical protein